MQWYLVSRTDVNTVQSYMRAGKGKISHPLGAQKFPPLRKKNGKFPPPPAEGRGKDLLNKASQNQHKS